MGAESMVINPLQPLTDLAGYFINRKGQEEADDRNWRHTVDLWNMNNEYNAPKNQMARMREAGLNPNLLFGQISAGNASQPSVPQSGSARFSLDMSRFLMRAEKEKTQEELDYVATQNRILKLKEEESAYNLSFYRKLGIPTKSPALATMIALGYNKLSGLPFTESLRRLAYGFGEDLVPISDSQRRSMDALYDDEIHPDWFKNGRVEVNRR